MVLALVGIGNVIRVVLRPKQHLRPVPVETLATEEPPTADEPPDQA